MNASDTIRLLIIQDDTNEVERMLSMLRNSGRAVRAQQVPSIEGFEKLLGDQAWDLLLAHENAKNCDPKAALRIIKKLDKDIPCIFLTEAEPEMFNMSLIDGLKSGARDVIVVDDDQHLLMTMSREIGNLQERRDRRIAERKLRESEKRCQQLLDNSKDAIAYVEDGMFLYANTSFAERFGYTDVDDILAIPVIDVISPNEQSSYKSFMKSFKLSDSHEQTTLSLSGIKSDGSEFKINIEVSHATFENDPCTQLLVAAKTGIDSAEFEAEIKKASAVDALTGLYNRVHFSNLVSNAVKNACENDIYTSLHIFSIDRFDELRTSIGMTGRDTLLANLAKFIQSLTDTNSQIGRISDDEFAILTQGIDQENLLKTARRIVTSVSEHIFQVGDKTSQITLSAGICPITEKIDTADQVFERAHLACDEVRAASKNNIGNDVKVYEPKLRDVNQAQDDNLIAEILDIAIDKDALEIKFQPMISLRGEPTEYYEVILNIPADESGKTISIDEANVALAKNESLARKLDKWITTKSIERVSVALKAGKKTQLFLSLTSATLKDENFITWIQKQYSDVDIPTTSIILQYSEVDATNHLTHTKAFVDNVAKIGATSCVTHFGCSLDPFKTLSHLNSSLIRLDSSFSNDIQKKGENPDHLKELLNKINGLNKQSVVPSVENATLLATLWQAGAHFIQGSYIQAPSDKLDFAFSEE